MTTRMAEILRASRIVKKVKERIRHDDRETIENKVRRWQQLRTPELPAEILEVGPWDPRWATLFEEEKTKIRKAFRQQTIGAVEHIGSTSIPGVAGKPILDLLVAVAAPVTEAKKLEAFSSLGYGFYDKSPCDPEAYWLWRVGDGRAFVVHLCELECPWIATAVNFRDYMRTHPDACAAYEACKERLAADKSLSPFEYSMEKLIAFHEISVKANAWAGKG